MDTKRQTFTPRELEFLAAIHEEPADDTPRLVYSDWLEESGDQVRAEFIRLQCLVAASRIDDGLRHYTPREDFLVKQHGRAWIGKRVRMRIPPDGELGFSRFHRGLPEVHLMVRSDTAESEMMTRAFLTMNKAPNWQLHIVLVVQNPEAKLAEALVHPLYARAQRLHVRYDETIGVIAGQRYVRAAAVPEASVRAVIDAFRDRKMYCISFGEVTGASKEVLRAELAPHVPTIISSILTRPSERL